MMMIHTHKWLTSTSAGHSITRKLRLNHTLLVKPTMTKNNIHSIDDSKWTISTGKYCKGQLWLALFCSQNLFPAFRLCSWQDQWAWGRFLAALCMQNKFQEPTHYYTIRTPMHVVTTPISHRMCKCCFSNFSTLLKFIYKWPHRTQCSTKYYYTVYYTQASVVQITTACTRSTQLLHLCTSVSILTLSSPVYYNSPIYWGLVRRGEAVLYSVWTPLAPTRSASLLQSLLPSPFIPQNAHHACTLHVLTCGWFARRADDPYLVYRHF